MLLALIGNDTGCSSGSVRSNLLSQSDVYLNELSSDDFHTHQFKIKRFNFKYFALTITNRQSGENVP